MIASAEKPAVTITNAKPSCHPKNNVNFTCQISSALKSTFGPVNWNLYVGLVLQKLSTLAPFKI